jgi:hypothetical protein
MTMLKRYLPPVAIVAGLLAMTAVGAIAGGDSTNPPSAGVPRVETIQPDAREAMAVFERGRDAVDALPSDVAGRMDANPDFGLNPSLSRLAIGNATSSVYVIPARDHVCASLTVGEGATLICPSTDEIASGRSAPATVVLTTRDIGIYGIVPDGVESVSVDAGSESIRVATDDNAYYTVVPAGTALGKVGYAGPSGPVEFAIQDPSALGRAGS